MSGPDRVHAPQTLTAGDLVTLPELRWLSAKSSLRGAGLVLHAWATIAAAMTVYAVWPSPLTFVAAVAVIGSRQLGLLVLMHETSHWLLFPDLRPNTWVGSWLCAYPLWTDLRRYRREHHAHHRHTQQPGDPDLALTAPYPLSRGALWRDALRDLSGVTTCARVLAWRPGSESAATGWRGLRGPVIANAALLGVLGALGRWDLYALLWVLPLVTWYPLVTRLRAIAEHAATHDRDDPLRNTRTTAAGLLARAFLAPCWVNYHLEHHLLVFVPCWKLARAHALLLAKGYGGRMELSPGYLDVIRAATALPATKTASRG
jgi:fatty acid desaturase